MGDDRECTCHPDEAPVPCQKKYAFTECEITRLREENARLREALRPFVPETHLIDPAIPDTRPIDVMVRAGELRAAAAAIRNGGTKHVP